MAKGYTRLSTGIFRDRYGIRAIVACSVGRKEKRFPSDVEIQDVKRWREEVRGKFASLALRLKKVNRRGTLSADIDRYLRLIKGLASWKSRRAELAAWNGELGTKRREQITEEMVRAAVAEWRSKGRNVGTDDEPQWKPYSVRTCEHRVATLRHLYHALDGPAFPTPCDNLTFELPPTVPMFVPAKTIRDVVTKLKAEPKTQARLMVLAATASRPAELMRAQQEDVDLDSRIWWIRTAKGGRARPLWLNDEMVAAWQAFIAAAAWGKYDTSDHARALRKAGWPAGIRPYAVRGTFGMELSRRGADLADIQILMGHTDQKTTRMYYVPPEDSRLAAASKTLGGRFGWKPAKRQLPRKARVGMAEVAESRRKTRRTAN